MLRDVGEFDGQSFSFGEVSQTKAPTIVTIDNGEQGASATIADAHLLFNSDFTRSGNDLHLNGHDGERAIVRDYFIADERVALLSGEGARLSPDVVEKLAGGIAPAQYAQAGQPAAPAANDAVGRVVTASGDAVIMRNGVPVTLRPGDPVLRADVLQTTSGTMAVTFNDGSTLNLTANTRIVVSEFVYSPNGTGNSQLLDLVQGSLTFISGEVAHSGNMRIGTPVATMGIRGTVGGVTTATDGTVQFYVSQSAVGAVIINGQGQVIANVVQDGPLIIVRPVGPLQVIAEEIQKTPGQLAVELQALQAIVNIKAVGDQLLQQFFQQQQPNPNPQTPSDGPHTQIPADQKIAISFIPNGEANGSGPLGSPGVATVALFTEITESPVEHFSVVLPPDLPPVLFAPLVVAATEDVPVTFAGINALTLADSDSAIVHVTIKVPAGKLSFSAFNSAGLNIAGDGTATIVLSGSPDQINDALEALTYTAPKDFNGHVAISIETSDGNSPPHVTTVDLNIAAVNDAPVITHSAGTALAYTENGAGKAIDSTLTLTDVDNGTLTGAKVTISGNFASGQDVLTFTAQGGITGIFNALTGVLTLSGTASLADYQAVLRSVLYQNTSDDPSGLARTISFEVNDGAAQNGTSTPVTLTVNVTPVNDAPVIGQGEVECSTVTFTEGCAPTVIGAGLTLADADGDTISSATVTISGNFHCGEDVLSFIAQGGITGIFNAQTGVLTLTGEASLADYETVLRSVTYENTSDDPSCAPRTISFQVNDGASENAASNAHQVTVDVTPVNDAPMIGQGEVECSTVAYTEGCAPAVISSGLTLSDADSDTISSATVTISGNFQCGEDVLSFIAQCGITGCFDSQTGVLTLTGEASLADYETVLRSVTYENTSDDPSCAPRTISFQVNDGASENAASNAHQVTVDVTPVNDAPVLNFFNVNLNGDEPVLLSPSDYGVTDPDGPIIIFTVTDVTGGEFVVVPGENNFFMTFAENEGPVTFTSQQIADGFVTFVPDGSGCAVSYSISVSDGISEPSAPIVDHLPQAENVGITVAAGSATASYNIVIVLDTSGSMLGERLALAKQAIANLLGNDSVDIKNVMAVSFASDGNVYKIGGNPWVSAEDANTFFQGRVATGGTNYVDAVFDVMSAWNSAPSGADKTLVYFISDGEPTTQQGLDDVPGLTSTWESFLHLKGVDTSYAIGISTGVSDTDLAPIAWREGDINFQPTILTSADGLDDTLKGTVIETHNIFDNTGTSYGVDNGEGARIVSLVVDGVTYTWNGANGISASDESAEFGSKPNSLTVITALGGTLVFYFGNEGGHVAGDWTYAAPAAGAHSAHDIFTYTIADTDGDQASANIDVLVQGTNIAPVAANDTILIDEDMASEGLGALLKANDTDADHDALTITSVSSATHGTVDLNNGNPIFTPDENFSGQASFQYTITDGVGGTSTATVNVDVAPVAEKITVSGAVEETGTTPVAAGDEILVNSSTAGAQYGAAVAALTGGGFVVTWTTGPNVPVSEVYGQRFDGNGVAVGEEFFVSAATGGVDHRSSVTGLADGGFVVTWLSDSQMGSFGFFGQRYDGNGDAVGGEFRVGLTVESFPFYGASSVTSLDDGGFVVAWTDTGNGVFAQRFDEYSASVGGAWRVNSIVAPGVQYAPSVSALANGGFVITWEKPITESGSGIFGQIYDQSGLPVGSEFRANTFTGGSQYNPSVSGLSDGGFIVAWSSLGQTGDGTIYGQHFDAGGIAVGVEFMISTQMYGAQRSPTVTGLPDGGFLVTWTSSSESLSDVDVVGQRFDANGLATGDVFTINQTIDGAQAFFSGAGAPGLAVLASGEIVQVWGGESANSAGDIYARVFDITQTSHVEGQPISLSFAVDYGDVQADVRSLNLSGLPAGFTISDGDSEHFAISTGEGYNVGVQDWDLSSLVVNPAAGWAGAFTVTLTAAQAEFAQLSTGLVSDTATTSKSLTITVEAGLAHAPVAVNDIITIDEDTASAGLGDLLKANDTDADHDTLTITSVGNATHGMVDLNNGDPIFTPDENFSGQASFQYTIKDGLGGTSTATVNVDVTPVAEAATVSGGLVTLDPTPMAVGGEFRVNSYTNNSQIVPAVAALSDGGFVVTWQSPGQDGSGDGIYAQRYDSSGAAVLDDFKINTYTASNQFAPSVTGLVGGGFVVAWQSNGQDGSSFGVYGHQYDNAGNAVGNEFRINTSTASTQNVPSVAALANGGFVVMWGSIGASNPDPGIFGQLYAASGVAVGTEFRVSSVYEFERAASPSVTSLSDGGFVVTWDSNGQDGSSYGVYGRHYSADGLAEGPEFHVTTHTDGGQWRSSVAALADDNFVVAWQSEGQDGSGYGIYAQRFNSAGPVGDEFRINATTSGDQTDPSVASLPDGGFVVVWTANGQDGSGYGEFGQRFDSAGTAVGSEFILNETTAGYQSAPAYAGGPTLAVLENGHLVHTWQGDGIDEGTPFDIYARLFDLPQAAHLEDHPISLSFTVDYGNDVSEGRALSLTGLPDGFTIADDSGHAATSVGAVITLSESWNIASLVITPAANWNGTFTATLTASNYDITTLSNGLAGDTATASQSVTITVAPVNDAPHAQDDHIIIASGNVISNDDTHIVAFPFDFLAANDDPDGGDIFTSAFAEPNHGLVASSPNTYVTFFNDLVAFRFDSEQSALMADTFQYSIANGEDGHATSMATVTVSVVADTTLAGGATNDIIVGSSASEVMIGGAGVDGFVFHANFGNDTVTDFQHGTDKLVFDDTVFATPEQALAAAFGATDAVIIHGTDTVTLEGVSAASLTVNDILIHHQNLIG